MTHPVESDRLLRLPQVLELLPISGKRLYQLINAGRFAKPVRIGANAVAWPRSAVSDYLELIAREQAAKAAGELRGRRGPAPKVVTAREAATAN